MRRKSKRWFTLNIQIVGVRCSEPYLSTQTPTLGYFCLGLTKRSVLFKGENPHSKVHGADMGPTWGPPGAHVGRMNLAIRDSNIALELVAPAIRDGCNFPLQWRHNGRDDVLNYEPHDCELNRLFRRRSKETLKLRITDICAGNSPATGEFPAQRANNTENVSISWHHHALSCLILNAIASEHIKTSFMSHSWEQ